MKWKAIKAFIIKTLKLRFRDRGDLFWVFIWPVILIILSATVFIPPGIDKPLTLKVGVVNKDINSTAPFNGTTLIRIISNVTIDDVNIFNIKEFNSTETLVGEIEKGKLDAGIFIPEDFGNDLIYDQGRLILYISSGDIQRRQIVFGLLSQFLDKVGQEISLRKIDFMVDYIPFENISTGYNITPVMIRKFFIGIASPLNVTYNDVTPESINSREKILGWYTIGAVGMVILYTGLWLGAATVVEEKDMGTLRRILSSPSDPSDLLIGKTIAGMIILGLSAILTIIIGIALGAEITWNPLNPIHWSIIIIFLLIALFTIGFGLILSVFSDNLKGASGLGIAVGLILSFIAGIWFPKWMLPEWMRIIADNFPATWGLDAIRNILVYNISIVEVYPYIIKLSISSIIIYLAGIYIFRKLIRKFAER